MASKEIKVLFISRKFPPSVGGMEKFAYELHDALGKQLSVRLVKWGGQNKYLPLVLPLLFIQSVWLLLTKKVDVIHAQDGIVALLGVPLKVLFRKPLCVVIHGLDITYPNALYQAVVPWALRRADRVICISEAARDEVVQRGINPDKALHIPIGVIDMWAVPEREIEGVRGRLRSRIGLAKNAKIILSVGRLVKRKGMEWFIEHVMPGIVQKDKNTYLVISGDGVARQDIERAISANGLQENVRLLGKTDESLLRLLYNGADLFVMPNITVRGDIEGFGLVLVEAALCRLPVVASGIEGIRDAVIDGQSGMLVPQENVEAFTVLIQKFLRNRSDAQVFGRQARRIALETFDWAQIVQQYVAVYRKLIK